MQFAPKTAEVLTQEREEARKLLKTGPGQFTVLTGETKNKDGHEYHLLTLDVWDSESNQKQINWVCLHPKALDFVRSFCYATGLEECYEAGMLTLDDCIGRSGNCEIGIAKGEPDGKGGRYPDKNKVKDFTPAQRQPAPPSVPAAVTEAARKGAFAAFKAANPGDPMAQNTQFKTAFTAYFGNRETTAVRADEWKKFQANGFVKHATPSPVSEEQQFKDDDIPF